MDGHRHRSPIKLGTQHSDMETGHHMKTGMKKKDNNNNSHIACYRFFYQMKYKFLCFDSLSQNFPDMLHFGHLFSV